MGLSLFAFLLAGLVSLPVVHEAGHGLGAWVVGSRRIRLVRRGLDLCVIAVLPVQRWRHQVFVAAGPVANLLFAALLLWLARSDAGSQTLSRGASLLAGLHGLYAAIQLLPLRHHDGAALCSREERDRLPP